MSPILSSYKILTTPPQRRSFPLLPSPTFFTGDLFDRLVLFLHKHHITFTSVECVARGVDKTSALADGVTLCVYVAQERHDEQKEEEFVVKKEGEGTTSLTEVNEAKKGVERKEKGVKEVSEWDKGSSGSNTNTQNGKNQLRPEKPQTSEEQASTYIAEVARLFYQSEFAKEIPPEVKFVEFVGVIIREGPGKTNTCNGGCYGTLG